MFDIGFGELIIISIVALVVFGPDQLPHAVRTAAKTVSDFKRSANRIKYELSHELKLQDMQDNLLKSEEDISSELKKSLHTAESVNKEILRSYGKFK